MSKSSFEEEIQRKGYLLYRVEGDSMMPLIRQDKDLVLISGKPDGRLKKYDVPLYKRDSGQYVLHRVLRVRENDYVLCGDNRWQRETDISDRHIIGVLTAVIRNGKNSRQTHVVTGCIRIFGATCSICVPFSCGAAISLEESEGSSPIEGLRKYQKLMMLGL